ncbi:5978_t:CDS:2 [Entrophospora sp. SA101]|nr:5978_t:CDS:2 [Entrophospora sp. SA101]
MEKKDSIIVSNLDSNNISNLLSIENYLAEWEKICVDFFNYGNKINRDVIKLVENSKITNGDVKIDFSVIEEGTTTTITEKEEVENILTKIGFINGILFHSQNFNKYIETKRKARSDWHKQKVIELSQELDALLHRQPAQYTSPHPRAKQESNMTLVGNNYPAFNLIGFEFRY